MLNIRMHSQDTRLRPKITVIGVGGAGGNAVNNMISSGLEGCEFLVCNTDAQALDSNIAEQKIQLGPNVTRGLGAGANPEIGAAAAEESIDEIVSYLDGANMVFVTAGMGGGTGTGAAPVIARAARERGTLTVGVVTKPFHFEGTHRMKLAENGIEDMQQYVDTLIVIPNQNLFRIANEKTTFADAFCLADEVLQSGVRGVTDLMVMPGLINLDFADIRAVMAEMGKAMMGTGEAEGERRALEAAEAAISNPLLDDISMKGARGVLINITGGMDMTLYEVDEAANRIRDEVDSEANIIFGSTFDADLEGKMRVSVVATGIDAELQKKVFRHDQAVKTQGYNKPVVQQPATPKTPVAEPEEVKTSAETSSDSENYATTQSAGWSPAPRAAAPVSPSFRTDIPKLPASLAAQNAGNTGAGYAAQAKNTTQPSASKPAQPAQSYETGHAETTVGTVNSGQTAAAVKLDESSFDVSATQTRTQTPVSQKRSPAFDSNWPQPQRSACGNSFIPPKPVDPRTVTDEELFSEEEVTAAAPQASTETPKAPLTAPQQTSVPVRPAAQQAAPQKEEKPSFFERLTGQRKAPVSETSRAAGSDVKKSGDDDELDIPAFLRRQAN